MKSIRHSSSFLCVCAGQCANDELLSLVCYVFLFVLEKYPFHTEPSPHVTYEGQIGAGNATPSARVFGLHTHNSLKTRKKMNVCWLRITKHSYRMPHATARWVISLCHFHFSLLVSERNMKKNKNKNSVCHYGLYETRVTPRV